MTTLSSPTGIWVSTARNGHRVHSVVRYEVYDIETACGQTVAVAEQTYSSEPEWDADVPAPPRPCPSCRKALSESET